MKNYQSLKSDKISLVPFILYHIILPCLCIIVCLVSPRKIGTNFMDIIPDNGISPIMGKAESAFTENQDRTVMFYVGSQTQEKASEATEALIAELDKSGLMESVSKGVSDYDVSAIQDFISENALYLLDDETIEKINEDPASFVNDSLSKIFGAFTVSSLKNLDKDPFLLSENVWGDYLNKIASLTSFSPKDGYLMEEYDGKIWISLNCLFKEESVSVAGSDNIYKFFSVCDKIQNEFSECEIVYSGIPLHSGESAAKSQKEIVLITGFSLVVMLFVFLLTCKNLKIIRLFLTSLFLSFCSAVSVLFILFKEFHVMTLLFGTTLMGTCIDYSIHYYVRYSKKAENETGSDVCRKLKKSLTVGFGSTVVCYMLLLFSGYPILRQIAVFSIAGLISSYLTTVCLYPNSVKPVMISKDSYIASEGRTFSVPSWVLYCIAVFATVFLLFSFPKLKIENNIMSLYEPSERLKKCEARASELMGYQSTTFGIIASESEISAAETEAEITGQLEDMVKNGTLDGYIATTQFIPPESQQKKSLEAARKLIPFLEEQGEILGISDDMMADCKTRLMTDRSITASDLPDEIKGLVVNVSLGQIDDRFCNVIILRNAKDNESVREIFGEHEDCHYFQTASDISCQLNELSRSILKLICIAFVLIVIALIIIFGIGKGFRMSLAPYCILTITISVSHLFGFRIDFFYVVGLILSIGLGLDYIVFASETGNDSSSKSVLLSFFTTELSFGTLIFSSFRPVHIFGFTVFSGIMVAYLIAMISRRK